eukprot:gb/GECG01001431.1/.p1 GENE.gb/GECG01001431.1/~~gb/GECG01001431.1/.p1  ORF type:complete len:960 (+),score=61.00 gb/GECG01001431.1/:1-2880(+)
MGNSAQVAPESKPEAPEDRKRTRRSSLERIRRLSVSSKKFIQDLQPGNETWGCSQWTIVLLKLVGILVVPLGLVFAVASIPLEPPASGFQEVVIGWWMYYFISLTVVFCYVYVACLAYTGADDPPYWSITVPLIYAAVSLFIGDIIPRIFKAFPAPFLTGLSGATVFLVIATLLAVRFAKRIEERRQRKKKKKQAFLKRLPRRFSTSGRRIQQSEGSTKQPQAAECIKQMVDRIHHNNDSKWSGRFGRRGSLGTWQMILSEASEETRNRSSSWSAGFTLQPESSDYLPVLPAESSNAYEKIVREYHDAQEMAPHSHSARIFCFRNFVTRIGCLLAFNRISYHRYSIYRPLNSNEGALPFLSVSWTTFVSRLTKSLTNKEDSSILDGDTCFRAPHKNTGLGSKSQTDAKPFSCRSAWEQTTPGSKCSTPTETPSTPVTANRSETKSISSTAGTNDNSSFKGNRIQVATIHASNTPNSVGRSDSVPKIFPPKQFVETVTQSESPWVEKDSQEIPKEQKSTFTTKKGGAHSLTRGYSNESSDRDLSILQAGSSRRRKGLIRRRVIVVVGITLTGGAFYLLCMGFVIAFVTLAEGSAVAQFGFGVVFELLSLVAAHLSTRSLYRYAYGPSGNRDDAVNFFTRPFVGFYIQFLGDHFVAAISPEVAAIWVFVGILILQILVLLYTNALWAFDITQHLASETPAHTRKMLSRRYLTRRRSSVGTEVSEHQSKCQSTADDLSVSMSKDKENSGVQEFDHSTPDGEESSSPILRAISQHEDDERCNGKGRRTGKRRRRRHSSVIYTQSDPFLDQDTEMEPYSTSYSGLAGLQKRDSQPLWLILRCQELFMEAFSRTCADLSFVISLTYYRFYSPNKQYWPYVSLDNDSYVQGTVLSIIGACVMMMTFGLLCCWIYAKHQVNPVRAGTDLLFHTRYAVAVMLLILVVLTLINSFLIEHMNAHHFAVNA